MSGIQVVAVDDLQDRAESMGVKIESAAGDVLKGAVKCIGGDDLSEAISALLDRKASFGEDGWSPHKYDHIFDEADVLAIDYQLSSLYGHSAQMTGENVAQLARLYSRTGVILSVNRFGEPEFDLRLRPRAESWADYTVAHRDLAISGLWRDEWVDEYRPWHWPVLASEPKLYEKRVDAAYRRREEPLKEVLSIPDIALKLMPDTVYDELYDLEHLNVLELADEYIIPPREPRASDRQLVRASVAVISKWLSSFVIPRQDVLIDAPHLVSLYPSLITEDISREVLDTMCAITHSANLPLDTDTLARDVLSASYWTNRPVWWTECVLENESIIENREPWQKEELPFVFAEDASQFAKPEDCQVFKSEGLFRHRYIRRSDKMREHAVYRPQSRLAG